MRFEDRRYAGRVLAKALEKLERVAARELAELERRVVAYRRGSVARDVRGKTVALVDDGLATGSTMRAAIASLKNRSPAKIVLAVPVCAKQTVDAIRGEVDEVVCAFITDDLGAVGAWYDDFTQTTDAEVHALLARRDREMGSPRIVQGAEKGSP